MKRVRQQQGTMGNKESDKNWAKTAPELKTGLKLDRNEPKPD